MKTRLLLPLVMMCLVVAHPAMAQDGDYIVIENFESDAMITLNPMANGSLDSPEAFERVENPDPDDVNPSDWVMRFTRAHDGNPWAGFWSVLPAPIDMTTHKYIHVQVWKPRVSPVRFKVEGGGQPAFEINPMAPQEETGQWENLVFHFEEATGEYPTIVFMPDFEDPVTLTANIDIYFDNIVLANTAEPPTATSTETSELPSAIALDQNYPNPFNPSTTISFSLSKAGMIDLGVYDLTGRRVATLADGMRAPGTYEVTFEAGNLPSGLYIYRLQSGERSLARTLTLLK
jgi:hypothetical protein